MPPLVTNIGLFWTLLCHNISELKELISYHIIPIWCHKIHTTKLNKPSLINLPQPIPNPNFGTHCCSCSPTISTVTLFSSSCDELTGFFFLPLLISVSSLLFLLIPRRCQQTKTQTYNPNKLIRYI